MIISVPAIFIVITNAVFPKLCQKFGAKTLTMIGLLLYTVGGCIAGAFSQIVLVLIMRAFVGIGVGIIMPLSTGLLSFYFPPERQAKLMGYSSAMNQMGGVVATLLSGVLANISWRLSFLVYLMGFFSIVLCVIFVPNDKIHGRAEAAHGGSEFGESESSGVSEPQASSDAPAGKSIFCQNYVYIVAMFLLMTTFFLYPANFAMETVADSVIPAKYIAAIMAGADLVAFFGGLLFVVLKKLCGRFAKFLAPILFLAGYLLAHICRRLVRRAGRLGMHRFCQRRGHPVYHLRGFRESWKSRSDHGHAVDLCGSVSGTVSLSHPHVHRADAVRQRRLAPAVLLCRRSGGLPLPLVRADPIREGDPVGAPGLRLRKQQLPVSRERPEVRRRILFQFINSQADAFHHRCFPPYLFLSADYFPLSP